MHFVIKKAYSPNDQHLGNWYMNQIYYQVIFVGHNGLTEPYSENIIVNGVFTLQLVKNSGKKAKFVYDWACGSETSLQ